MNRAVSDQSDLPQHRAGVDVVSDQLDLSQHQVRLLVKNGQDCLRTDRSSTHKGWLLCSSERGCLRSNRSSTAPGEAIVTKWAGLSHIRQNCVPQHQRGLAVIPQLSTLSQIR